MDAPALVTPGGFFALPSTCGHEESEWEEEGEGPCLGEGKALFWGVSLTSGFHEVERVEKRHACHARRTCRASRPRARIYQGEVFVGGDELVDGLDHLPAHESHESH
jgi:hypothetical protein